MHTDDIVRTSYAFFANVRVTFRRMDKEMLRNSYVTYKYDAEEIPSLPASPHLVDFHDTQRNTELVFISSHTRGKSTPRCKAVPWDNPKPRNTGYIANHPGVI
ncbi:hypothetical protein SK128_004517 [Halocaridina rubra]|uniref:Uncharacterized protein n=1 Tax=Halocaridina rubra TaxID=373956 RepID=A0AAN8WW02_HALRR